MSLAELDGLEPIWYEAAEKTLPIAPEMYTTSQYADFPLIGPVMARSDYYCLETEKLARRLAEDLIEAQGLEQQPIPEGTADTPDGFWWAASGTGDFPDDQFAVLLRGREVLAVIYHGVKDLRGAVPYLASLQEKRAGAPVKKSPAAAYTLTREETGGWMPMSGARGSMPWR